MVDHFDVIHSHVIVVLLFWQPSVIMDVKSVYIIVVFVIIDDLYVHVRIILDKIKK